MTIGIKMSKIVEAMNHAPTAVKATVDVSAVGIAWFSLLTDHLPELASVLSIVWLSLQIYAFFSLKKWKHK